MKNYSKQREEIITVLKDMYNHPTAEDIYFLVKQKDPAVSRSTVYRNLGDLVENKIVNQISISNGPDRYDYMVDCEEHIHVICTKCGNVYDLFGDIGFEKIKQDVFLQTGVKTLISGVCIKGICESCRNIT